MKNENKPAMPQCDWCGSVNIEQVGTEYNGKAILHCKDCSHEFLGGLVDKTKQDEWEKGFKELISEVFEDCKKENN